jgi:hypothetical protein
MVHAQLTAYLHNNELLHDAHYGFTAGRLTVTNMVHFNATIAVHLQNHTYYIITIDFKRAFDKATKLCAERNQ